MEDSVSTDEGSEEGFWMSQARYIYCTPYFYDYYSSSTSDHQALAPGRWGPLPKRAKLIFTSSLRLGNVFQNGQRREGE